MNRPRKTMPFRKRILFLGIAFSILGYSCLPLPDRGENRFAVIAYVHGRGARVDSAAVGKVTHVCYSFLRLRGNKLFVNGVRDSTNISTLVSLKKLNPALKVMLSVGGWGGCEHCSDVFSTKEGRKEFTESAKEIVQKFGVDGIDLDWEYPAVEGYPGHKYSPNDRENFTLLVQELRDILGKSAELSFAAGAFTDCMKNSVEWNRVMPLLDRVHLMTYDFVNGNSTATGHHTPLYSTPDQRESTDGAVRFLDSAGVPREKIVIGAAFYARMWGGVEDTNNGLFQPGKFARYVSYKDFDKHLNRDDGFVYFRDSIAQAPYSYNAKKKLFATFDDPQSVRLKTQYALRSNLGGIMFWELSGDRHEDGLLDAIDNARKKGY